VTPRLLRWILLAILITPVAVYAADDALVRLASDPFDTVTVYVAAQLKNKQVEIYYHQPEAEVCVRALMPHLGRRPCWYVRRHPLKFV
jgi:hypothetical protein